jgi:transposase InsO family protein
MATRYTDEFRRDAVRIATSSSLTRPRMTEELQELGLSVGHRHVGRLMSENGIKTLRTQKYKATTDPCTAGYAEHAREGATIRSTLPPIWRVSDLLCMSNLAPCFQTKGA